jgi:hypothetical protein
MELSTIPTPGMPGGPCRGSCDHQRCHSLRALAFERCPRCFMHLGFGARVTGDPPMHARCARAAQIAAERPAEGSLLARALAARATKSN